MQQLTFWIFLPAIIVISSCANPDKPGDGGNTPDSLSIVDSISQPENANENRASASTPSLFDVTDLLSEGTYLQGQLPSSIDSGNWYALIGKEAGISQVVKIELIEAVDEPSEGEDYTPNSYISTAPKTYGNAIILFRVDRPIASGEIHGRREEKFIEPDSNYELALPGFFLQGEGTASVNELDETSYEQYGLVLNRGNRVQQLYSNLSFSVKTPLLIWSGDLNKDGFVDLLIQSSIDESDTEAHYELWLSDPAGEGLLKLVAEHKIFPAA